MQELPTVEGTKPNVIQPLMPRQIRRLNKTLPNLQKSLALAAKPCGESTYQNPFKKEAKMAALNLLTPYNVDERQGAFRVKTIRVPAALVWNEYYKYQYLFGIGVKLNRIARHTCGSALSAVEQLERAQRLIAFMDATGCKPIAAKTCPKSHKDIELLDYPDHLTYWHGPNDEPLVLVEPYTSLKDIKLEISERGLTALVLQHPGIYGGRGTTSSVFMADPRNKACLQHLSAVNWSKPLGEVTDINWFEALNLGKERQS